MAQFDLFEWASKNRIRFEMPQGQQFSTEDLWGMPLKSKSANSPSLSVMARHVHSKIKETSELDFIEEKSVEDRTNERKLDILKHIIESRKEEQKKAEEQKLNKQQKEYIDQLLLDKKNEELRNKSPEELQRLRDSL